MITIILQILTGFTFISLGSYITFLYIQELTKESNLYLLSIAIFLYCLAAFFCLLALKPFIKSKNQQEKPDTPTLGLETVLEKNNSLNAEFGKTNDTRNKLKILQASADAQNQ